MIEHKPDKVATKAARKAKVLIDRGSYISYAGHLYLRGQDRGIARHNTAFAAKYICAICGTECPIWDGDYEHIKSGRPVARCDCNGRILPDGTICTNVQWVHGMFSRKSCHRKKHNREVMWTRRQNELSKAPESGDTK